MNDDERFGMDSELKKLTDEYYAGTISAKEFERELDKKSAKLDEDLKSLTGRVARRQRIAMSWIMLGIVCGAVVGSVLIRSGVKASQFWSTWSNALGSGMLVASVVAVATWVIVWQRRRVSPASNESIAATLESVREHPP